MKTKRFTLLGTAVTLLTLAQTARCAEGQGLAEGMGFWTILFLVFGGIILLFQAAPAFLMLGGMLAALFKKPALKAGEEEERGI